MKVYLKDQDEVRFRWAFPPLGFEAGTHVFTFFAAGEGNALYASSQHGRIMLPWELGLQEDKGGWYYNDGRPEE